MPEGKAFANSLGMEMVRIEPGTFWMGQAEEGDWDERPLRRVTIGRAFFMGRTEVTVEQFRRFRPGWQGTEEFEPLAAGVSWHDAAANSETKNRDDEPMVIDIGRLGVYRGIPTIIDPP